MNVKDAAETLGVSTQRVYALLKAGLLRGTRTPGGRRWADVDEMSVAHYQRSAGASAQGRHPEAAWADRRLPGRRHARRRDARPHT